MSVTLTNTITAAARVIAMTGDCSAAVLGELFRFEDELVRLDDFLKLTGHGGDHSTDYDHNQWRVSRGMNGTAAVSHNSGTSVVSARDGYSAGTDLAAPSPFPSGGGGSLSVTDGTTTIAAATSLHLPAGTLTDLGGSEAGVAFQAYTSRTVLSNAEILTLQSVGKVLVPAPGSGFAIIPFTATLVFHCPTTSYTPNNPADYIVIGTGLDDAEEILSDFTPLGGSSANDQIFVMTPMPTAFTPPNPATWTPQGRTHLDNAALTISLSASADPTGGASGNTLTVTVAYFVLTL